MVKTSLLTNPSPRGMLAVSKERNQMELTTAEAATELGVSRRRVRQYITEGRLKARKLGRDYIIDSRSLAAFKPRRTGRPMRDAR